MAPFGSGWSQRNGGSPVLAMVRDVLTGGPQDDPVASTSA
jgi:hypothetical protein